MKSLLQIFTFVFFLVAILDIVAQMTWALSVKATNVTPNGLCTLWRNQRQEK